ncbi:MAG TPA: hypothetical protein VF829_03500 [Candidatus Paceibacterota bacterium]
MHVIDVTPFARHAPEGALSYRFRERLAIGTIVSVPLRKKTVPGIVVGCVSVRDAKSDLKNAPFTLRAGSVRTTGVLPAPYREAAIYTAEYHALPLGTVLRALLPETLLEHEFPKRLAKGPGATLDFCEAPYRERVATYAETVGHSVSSAGTVLIVAPTAIEVAHLAKAFPHAVVVSGSLAPKARERALAAARRAAVVITTPQYAFTPIEHLAHVILEHESAGGYLTRATVPIDLRVALVAYAEARDVPLTRGDYPLRLEVRPTPTAPLEAPAAPIHVHDVREKKAEVPTARTFRAITPALQAALEKALRDGGRAAVLAVRKGYASAVVCRDCGAAVRDAHGRALSLATAAGKRVFRSSDGAVERDAKALCDVCGSWNLLPLGVGVERVAEELAREFPKAHIVRFDADTIKTPAAARRAAAHFTEPGTLIVGTEALIPWLDPSTPLDVAAIASADSLLALPFWRARERLASLAFSLSERAQEVHIATRRPDDTVFATLANPLDTAFFTEETTLRKRLGYPPFGHLITFAIEGTDARLPDRLVTPGKKIRTLVAKLGPDTPWPHKELATHLAQLPPWITVRIDPESLWQ